MFRDFSILPRRILGVGVHGDNWVLTEPERFKPYRFHCPGYRCGRGGIGRSKHKEADFHSCRDRYEGYSNLTCEFTAPPVAVYPDIEILQSPRKSSAVSVGSTHFVKLSFLAKAASLAV